MATVSNTCVVGVFPDQATAQEVENDLMRAGIPKESIVTSGSDRDWTSGAATGGAAMTGRAPEHHHGGFMGWLERLFGGGDSDDEQRRYRDAVQRGRYVVAVDAVSDDTRDRVVDVMKDHDAIDIDEDASGTAASREFAGSGSTGAAGKRSIPVVEEELAVGKRPVQRGGVRVYTRSVEQPVEQQVNLREEQVNVERRPADRPVTDAEASTLRDQTIEVTETTEEPVVNKRARVVEEVVVGKEARERTETIRDKVRKQEVEVEPIGQRTTDTGSNYSATGYDRYDDDFQTDYQTNFAQFGGTYADYQPAYQYGYRMASDDRYRSRKFEDVEDTVKTEYLRNNPNSTWDRVRGAVRYGWERATGKR